MVLLLVEVMQIAQDNIMSDILPDLFRNIATDLIFFVLFQVSTCILIMRQLAANNILNNHAQLHLIVESSALRLITGS